MKNSLIQLVSRDSKKRERLEASIERKRAILEELMEEVESLKLDLDLIKHEYNVRIGGLLLKDNQLDLEILQLKNLQELMRGGMTYAKAAKHEEDAFYSEMLKMQQEQERINEEKRILDEIADVSEEVMQDIHTIWKNLIRKFHPDLVTNPQEKAQREEVMKKINKAYTERNLEALKAFESTQDTTVLSTVSVKDLETMLEKIENAILDEEGELTILKKSTWYEWKKKIETKNAGAKKIDVFAQLEQSLLDDIVKKIETVQKLRAEVKPS